MAEAKDILKKFWGYSSFRPLQQEIIDALAAGQDVLALMPTGGGKSLCFQVPALLKNGLGIVITPLIALMNDQVVHLRSKGIPAMALHSGLTPYELNTALKNAVNGDYKFLYISPERMETALFRDFLPDLPVNIIAVDEAHCISQWGYDFRPPYLRIAQLRTVFPTVPVIAVTASATPKVQADIIEKLHFRNYDIFKQPYERSNLSFSVLETESKINKLSTILQQVPGSSIVYGKSRKRAQDIANLLQLQGLQADFYHAGLTQEERNRKQNEWTQNKTRIMVCTNAFGMGIDKPDVRTVIHYDAPDCLENYYQEAGRAGRDRKKAYAVLLVHPDDLTDMDSLPDIHYPDIATIRNIYQAVGNYLQVPVGGGEGQFFNFDLTNFVRNFKLNPLQTLYALKALEQEGLLQFTESIFLPAKISFTTDRETLSSFEEAHPGSERILKCLLRLYEGIFEHRVSIFEDQIARYCHLPKETVLSQLQELQRFRLIEYLPQKDTPQVYYPANRAPAEFLHFNPQQYLERRKEYTLRLEKMKEYISLKNNCRAAFIAHYFGDNTASDCGICDNCREKRKLPLSANALKELYRHLGKILPPEGLPMEELRKQFPYITASNWQTAIRYLAEERKISLSKEGNIRLMPQK